MDSLHTYIAEAREQNIPDSTIKSTLLEQGWKAADISAALKQSAPHRPEAPKPPADQAQSSQPSVSPLFAALQHVFLWFFLASSIPGIFLANASIAGEFVPLNALASFLAAIAVTAPVYLVFYILYLRKALRAPFITAHKVWSIITICLSGIAALSAIVSLLVSIINEAPGWVLWSLALVALINASIILTYIGATFLRPSLRARPVLMIVGPSLLVGILAVISIWSLIGLGDVRHDELLRKDLVKSVTSIREYTEENAKLPNANDITLENNAISYAKTTTSTYELCTTFKRDAGSSSSAYNRSYTSSAERYTRSDASAYESQFRSEKGKQCFTLRASSLPGSSSRSSEYDY